MAGNTPLLALAARFACAADEARGLVRPIQAAVCPSVLSGGRLTASVGDLIDRESQSSVSGEVSIDGGSVISTEAVDLGDGVERVTVTDTATGTQFTGVRTQLENGYGISGDIAFPDGSNGTVTVTDVDGVRQIDIESDALEDGDADITRDLDQTASDGFGLVDDLVEIFDSFSLFGNDPDPLEPPDPTGPPDSPGPPRPPGGSDGGAREPNGGQVEGADPGVGRDDVPDSF